MRVSALTEAEFAVADARDENFTLRRSQWFGIGILAILLVVLTVIFYQNAHKTVGDLKNLSNDAKSMSNVLLTQHESLQFASSYERWLSGTTTRSNLEVRRDELTQKLDVVDNTGVSLRDQLDIEYNEALRILDGYISGTPAGFLPPEQQIVLRAESDGALDTFIMRAREMVVASSDDATDPLATLFEKEISRQNIRNATLLVALTLIFLVAGFIAFSYLRDLRKIRVQMQNERQKLDETNVALKQVDDELQLRLDQERIDRAEHEWLTSSVRSISSQIKSTIDPDTIAESLVKGLGRALGVDVVLFYSFPNFPMQRLWKQWHKNSNIEVEESLVAENESDLFRLAEHLWNKKRNVIVNDSQLIDVSNDPLPKLAAITQMRARSWILVPLGAGSQVLGCLGVGMFDQARVWTKSEIELIQKVDSEVADMFIQVRLFRQSMQIAENDAEVNRLVELDKVKNDVIENLNHELRTPLASIIGYMAVIMDDPDAHFDSALESSLIAVQRNAVRLQSMIENMMQISKADFQQAPLAVAPVDVGQLLGEVVNSLKMGVADSGVMITLQMDSPPSDLIIEGDVNQLERVFINLTSNAIKFTPHGGTVTVVARRFRADGDFVEVKVIDTGIGIPPEEFPNVFKRFFRASTATQAAIPGFGIGLSLVHSIVGEHHGAITFDSTIGKGTVFTVTLPVRHVSARSTSETI